MSNDFSASAKRVAAARPRRQELTRLCTTRRAGLSCCGETGETAQCFRSAGLLERCSYWRAKGCEITAIGSILCSRNGPHCRVQAGWVRKAYGDGCIAPI